MFWEVAGDTFLCRFNAHGFSHVAVFVIESSKVAPLRVRVSEPPTALYLIKSCEEFRHGECVGILSAVFILNSVLTE